MARTGGVDRGLKEHPKGSGIWWVDIYHEGRRIRDKVGSKEEARRRLPELRRELREGRRTVKVRDLLQEYLPEMLRTNDRDRDVRRYVAEFEREFGSLDATDLTLAHVQDWKERRLARPSTPGTVNRILAVLRRILALACRDGRLERNVALEAGRVPGERPRTRRLTADEVLRLRVEMGTSWRVAEFALETGMRQAQQFRLRRQQVDLARGRLLLDPPVRLSARAREILAGLLAEHDAEWVFVGPRGSRPAPGQPRRPCPLNPRNFYNRVFQPAVRRAGIRDLTWDDLRRGAPQGGDEIDP